METIDTEDFEHTQAEPNIAEVAGRIRERLDELKMSPRAASLATGRGSDVIRNLLRAADEGRPYNPRTDTLDSIARALKVKPTWLLWGTGEKAAKERPLRRDTPSFGPRVALRGVVEAGAFRSVDVFAQDSEGRVVAELPPDPRFASAAQFAWEVRGDSMNKMGIVEGSYVTGITYYDFRREYGYLRTGMLVVAERVRMDGAEREVTVKEVQILTDQIALVPRSTNPAHKAIVLPRDFDPETDTTVSILAIVTSVHNFLPV